MTDCRAIMEHRTFADRHRRALAACAMLATLVVSGSAAAAGPQSVNFVLDWAFQGQQAPFTLAIDDGTFASHQLEVKVDRGMGSGDTVVKVASGAYDIGQADLYSMVRFNNQNPDRALIAVFMVNDKSPLAVETLADGPVKTPQDLNGRTIAAPVGDASRQLFPLFAAVNKVDQASIKWNNVSPELRETMLIKRQADAITGNVPTVMLNIQAVNMPASAIRLMPYSEFGVDLYGLALVTRPDFAAKNPEAIRDFIRGTVHGLNRMIKDPEAAVASVKKRDPLINDKIERDRIDMTLKYQIITPNVLSNGYSNVDVERLERTLKVVAPSFEMKTVPAVEQVYTAKYLPPRSELAAQH